MSSQGIKLAIASILYSLIIAELLLRAFGYSAGGVPGDSSDTPFPVHVSARGLHTSDSLLGWRQVPGTHRVRIPASGRMYQATILEDGSRTTFTEGKSGSKIFLSGGSMVQGFGLEDEDTLGSVLGSKISTYPVKNLGVTGYGTYQSLLLSREFDAQIKAGDLVFYGFCSCHINRNVFHPDYGIGLAGMSSTGSISMPYCDFQGDAMHCMPAIPLFRYNFLRSKFAIAQLLEIARLKARIPHCDSVKGKVTQELLLQFKEFVESRGAEFYLFPVDMQAYAFIESKPALQGVPILRCMRESMTGKHWKLADDNHPNSRWTQVMADCLADYIREIDLK